MPLNTTNLIVLRYRYKTVNTTDDEFTIWTNPPSSSFGASEAAAPAGFFTNTTGSVVDQAAIASVNIGNYTSSNSGGASFGNTNGGLMFLDEIRVATTWAEVTPSSCLTATITTSPTNRTIFSGLGTTFNSAATGDTVTNQWQYSSDGGANFIVISGATSADYTTNSVTTGADRRPVSYALDNGVDSTYSPRRRRGNSYLKCTGGDTPWGGNTNDYGEGPSA